MGWGGALLATGLLVALATLPPFVGAGLRSVIMDAFSPVCHQMPDRSPHLHGVPFAVCHRCYGIYWGLFVSVSGFFLIRRWDAVLYRHAGPVMVVALAVPGIDWLGDVLGFWMNTPVSRLATGSVLGVAAGYYLARAFAEFGGARRPPGAGTREPEHGATSHRQRAGT